MVLHHIRKIRNPHVRRATYGILSLHGLFLTLVAIKTAIFHIARLKAVVYGSAALMSLLDFVPHVTFAQAPTSIDYSISNSTYPIMTDQGQLVTYMYYYQNESSPYTVGSSVVVSANIPAGMTYHSHEWPAIASQNASQITWNIPANQSRFGMILLRLLVAPEATWPLNNTVTITHGNPDPVTTNNNATAIIIANNTALASSNVDLQISKTVNRNTATLMDDIIFTINYSNQGTQAASGVKVYEVLPPELYIVNTSLTPSSTQNNLYTWDIGTLAPGQGGTITLRTSILPIVENGETIINYAVVSSNMVESNIHNNSAEVSIVVQDAEPNMDIAITAPKTTICVNETLRFTVNIANQGIGNANNVSVRHDKPSSLGWEWSSRAVTSPSIGVYNWTYNTSFFPWANGSFTFDLKGLVVGENQLVPVTVLSNGVEYDTANYTLTIVPESLCNVIEDPDPIPWCTNPSANNYNPNATQNDGSCTYTSTGDNQQTPWCTNPNATNYNPNATVNNGTCTFAIPWCTNPAATNYNPNATVSNGSCIMPTNTGNNTVVTGCMNPAASNYNPNATVSSGYCQFPTNTNTGSTSTGWTSTGTTNTGTVVGCMNPAANNYNPAATVSSGVCTFNPNTGTGWTGEEKSFFILPKATITAAPSKPGTTKVAKPSSKFFTTTPAPKKPTTQQTVQTIKQAIATTQSAPVRMEDIPVTCESNMVSIYQYAKQYDLIDDSDVPDLCKPITRAKLAELMVNYALKLALVEPNLQRRCVFDDIGSYDNESKFFIALACDFGFLGVNKDGSVQKQFRPDALVSRAEFALTATRFLFGDTIKDPLPWQPWYSSAMQALHDAYVMRSIDNPSENILLGHVLSMMRRIDLAELLKNTKYIRIREKK